MYGVNFKLSFLMLCFILSGNALADDSTAVTSKSVIVTPTEKLLISVDNYVFSCRLSGSSYLLELSMGTVGKNNHACIEEAKAEFKVNYKPAKSSLEGNKDATQALDDYAATALALLDDLKVRSTDSDSRYDNRVANIKTELAKKSNYLKLQLD